MVRAEVESASKTHRHRTIMLLALSSLAEGTAGIKALDSKLATKKRKNKPHPLDLQPLYPLLPLHSTVSFPSYSSVRPY